MGLLVNSPGALAFQQPAAAQQQPELTAEQKQKLAERDRWAEETTKLRREGKLTEAIAACERMLAIERDVFGGVHDDVAGSLQQLAEMHEEQEAFDAARAARQGVLDIQTQLHGTEHWHVADARLDLADLERLTALGPDDRRQLADVKQSQREVERLYAKGKHADALPLAQRLSRTLKDLLGEEHRRYAKSVNDLGMLYQALGRYTEAESLLRRATEIHAQVLGRRHPLYAASLNNLGLLYYEMGKYDSAEPLYRAASEIWKRTHGAEHADYVIGLNNLAVLYYAQAKFDRAASLHLEVLEIRKRTVGEEHSDYATSLHNLAAVYGDMGAYDLAEPLLRQAVEISRRVDGEEHPNYAQSLNNLALLYTQMGDYATAEPLHRQALQLTRILVGEQHRAYASCLTNLAQLYMTLGEYTRAEPLARQALEIRKTKFGTQHYLFAQSLNNLGVLYKHLGDIARAEEVLRQAAETVREALGEKHPEHAASLNNLAGVYLDTGDFERAEALYQQALEIRKAAVGEHHRDVAQSLNNLGHLYRYMQDDARAESHYRQALGIWHAVPRGTDQPGYASTLNNLGIVYKSIGDFARAEECLRDALDVRRRLLGAQHPECATSLNNLGMLYDNMGDYARSESLVSEGLDMAQEHLALAATALSERQQLAMARSLRGRLDAYLSMALRAKLPAARPYQRLLAWKGAVSARQRLTRFVRRRPEFAPLVAELQRTASRLETLAFAVPDLASPGAQLREQNRRRQIAMLTDEKERLEVELAQNAEFHSEQDLRRRTPEDVLAVLPPGTALVDFLEYTYFSRPADGTGPMKGDRQLTAFVVRPDRGIVHLDLGPTAPLAEAIEKWRARIVRGRAKDDTEKAGFELRKRLWDPLEKHLDGVHTLLVSPDGVVGRFPLAALPGKQPGTHMIEEMPLAVVAVPQMLPELGENRDWRVERRKMELAHSGSRLSPPNPHPSLLLVGDVTFGTVQGEPSQQPEQVSAVGRVAVRGDGFRDFDELPRTADEIHEVRAFWEKTQHGSRSLLLRREAATEQALREHAPGSRYVHLATHGFFVSEETKSALALSDGQLRSTDLWAGRESVVGFHLGLLSGIALAGANNDPNRAIEMGTDDGILTTMEVAEMDLSGTDLVVLSACDTGLGRVAGGEGILGLQRAFQMAGARTVVASLWKVDDEITRLLMTEFYRNLWEEKLPKLEALRQAQLHVMRHGPGDSAHPRYWAGWVLSGDPGDLSKVGVSADAGPSMAADTSSSKSMVANPPDSPRTRRYAGAAFGSIAGLMLLAAAVVVIAWRRSRRAG